MKHFDDFFVSNNSLLQLYCVDGRNTFRIRLTNGLIWKCVSNMYNVHSFKIDVYSSIKSLFFFQDWAWKETDTSGSTRCDWAMGRCSTGKKFSKKYVQVRKKATKCGKTVTNCGIKMAQEWRKPLCWGFQKVGAKDLFCAAHF